jgi:hypothetical protein
MEDLPEAKNEIRYKEGSGNQLMEIITKDGHIVTIDADQYEKIYKYRWCTAAFGSNNHRYAVTNIRNPETGEKTLETMHVLLYPDIEPPRDHIDRNGLNNARSNIRSGAAGVNHRNRTPVREDATVGVATIEYLRRYKAFWMEANGFAKSKTFSWSKYDSKEQAYAAALKCRTENNERVIREILANPEKSQRKQKSQPHISNSGIKNVICYYKIKTIRATKTINKKRFTKEFGYTSIPGSKEEAIEKGRLYIEQIKQENPSEKKKRKTE